MRGEGTKIERAKPYSAACEASNVTLVRAPWNKAFVLQAEAFPEGKKDDMIDAASGGQQQAASPGGFYIRSTS